MNSESYPPEVYWLAIAASELPYEGLMRYTQDFHGVEGIWDAPAAFLQQFLTEDQLANYEKFRSITDLQIYRKQWDRIKTERIELIPITDMDYPLKLKGIRGKHPNTPPLILLRSGNHRTFDKCIAVVGTRESSLFGVKNAHQIGMDLAQHGYVVVSGLAKGIDAAAHEGCLAANGRTIGIIAWLNPIYPKENKPLADSIQHRGALISERYEVPSSRSAHMFIHRNRITSGISDAVVIIESPGTGGTIWQFELAKEQGRPIFILRPPPSNSSSHQGFEELVSRGATPFVDSTELLDLIMFFIQFEVENITYKYKSLEADEIFKSRIIYSPSL